MKNTLLLTWLRELLWWIATAAVTAIVLMPAYGIIKNELLWHNAGLIVVAITMFRFTVFFKQVPYIGNLYIRVALLITVAVAFFQFLRVLQDFHFVMENYTISTFLSDQRMFMNADQNMDMFIYFKHEYLFFNVTILIMSLPLMLRIIAALWKQGRRFNFDRKEDEVSQPVEQN